MLLSLLCGAIYYPPTPRTHLNSQYARIVLTLVCLEEEKDKKKELSEVIHVSASSIVIISPVHISNHCVIHLKFTKCYL